MKTLKDTGVLPPRKRISVIEEKLYIRDGCSTQIGKDIDRRLQFNSALSEISSIPVSKILERAIKEGLVGLDKEKIKKIIFSVPHKDGPTGAQRRPLDIATALADSNVVRIKKG